MTSPKLILMSISEKNQIYQNKDKNIVWQSIKHFMTICENVAKKIKIAVEPVQPALSKRIPEVNTGHLKNYNLL